MSARGAKPGDGMGCPEQHTSSSLPAARAAPGGGGSSNEAHARRKFRFGDMFSFAKDDEKSLQIRLTRTSII